MRALGFNEKWIELIMSCVSIVSYLVLVNGKSRTTFIVSRGLRQRDSLFPYLFIFCTEGFSFLLTLTEIKDEFKGLSATKRGISISHLLLVDGSILFSKATKGD